VSHAHLKHAIEHAAHLLPAQGPITVFIHHNTLHAFEDLPFEEAVVQGSQIFGCKPFLDEPAYRQMLDRERIRVRDLEAVLEDDLRERGAQQVLSLCSRYELRLAMLRHPLHAGATAELRWMMAESDALRTFRPDAPATHRERLIADSRHWIMRDLRDGESGSMDSAFSAEHAPAIRALVDGILERFSHTRLELWKEEQWEEFSLHLLWRICRHGARQARTRSESRPAPVRHRDALLEATGEDTDRLVHDLLIRFTSSFLDQGFASWPLPDRRAGYFRSFLEIYRRPGGPPDRWLRGLATELQRIASLRMGPLDSIAESLDLLGVDDQELFMTRSLLALRGWAGMIWQMEQRADRAVQPASAGSLIEFLAVRLVLDRLAAAHVAREALGFAGPLAQVRDAARRAIPERPSFSVDQRAFVVFQLAQVLGWDPLTLWKLAPAGWDQLLREIEAFSGVERRRVFQLAYERRFVTRTLDAVAARVSEPAERVATPEFQALFCLDEREESMRRHLEEVAPHCETFGAAGFFNIPIYYRGAADAHFMPLAPVVIRPQHYVREDVVYTLEELHRRRARTRQVLGTATHQMHVGSRSFAGGAFLAALFGPLANFPLVARILFPRLTSRIRRIAGSFVRTPPLTQLQLERSAPEPGPERGHLGFSVPEMAAIVERLLRDIGLTSRFAPLVLVCGHGSSSLNNPHGSAYNCGACGGGMGGPNARSFAQMANDPRIRELLKGQGIHVPSGTWFVGGLHNTCNDGVTWFDLERLPPSHKDDFARAVAAFDEARCRNAHERCRRFESAPLHLSPEAALRHVEGRSEDLAQTRPECGHATNAICIVGRRERIRGLFLDRRAFLTSYDPTQDDAQSTILTRLLSAAVPVCAGINLEYYFSYVDPAGFGCSTKLPHNVTSLLGVMDGAASDLRTGLPWQMVEIHEPVRLLFIIEATPEALTGIMERNESIGRLIRNRWVLAAVLDPESNQLQVYHHGRFLPYTPETPELVWADSSVSWYRGWRDHLGFARIGGTAGRRLNPHVASATDETVIAGSNGSASPDAPGRRSIMP
jgi:hypothetical protein